MLGLGPGADASAVKRAYRRLARAWHPDVGGDVEAFHRLQRAYEVARGGAAEAPPPPPGRPSRPRAAWDAEQDGAVRGGVDLGSVSWDLPDPTGAVRLDRDRLACWLAGGDVEPLRPCTATSRAPGSRLNGAAAKLASDLTSALTVAPATDDRGRLVVAVTLTAGNRRARRALDDAALDGGWIRRRGSASTTLERTAAPDDDRRATALRTTEAVDALLERLDWPLSSWTMTPAA